MAGSRWCEEVAAGHIYWRGHAAIAWWLRVKHLIYVHVSVKERAWDDEQGAGMSKGSRIGPAHSVFFGFSQLSLPLPLPLPLLADNHPMKLAP